MMMLTTTGRKRKEAPAPIGQQAQPAADNSLTRIGTAGFTPRTTTARDLTQVLAVEIILYGLPWHHRFVIFSFLVILALAGLLIEMALAAAPSPNLNHISRRTRLHDSTSARGYCSGSGHSK
jgi:hypothetical protein